MSSYRWLTVAIVLLLFFTRGGKAQGASPEQIARIRQLQKPIREKVETILKKDPSGQYAMYQKDMDLLQTIRDAKKRAEHMRSMQDRHLAWVRKGFQEAAIDQKAFSAAVAEILGGRFKWKPTEFMGVVIISLSQAEMTPSSGAGCKEFIHPCDVRDWYPSDGFSLAFREVSGECWVMGSVQAMVAGSNESGAHAGINVEVPRSMRRVHAKARVKFSLEASATAILGGGYAESMIGMSIAGPDVNRSNEAFRIQVLAPVIMFDSDRLEDERDISVSATPPARGGIFTVLAWSRVKVVAGGVAGSSAKADIIPLRSIKVCWE